MQILRNNQKQNNATIKGNRNMQCKKRAFRDFVVVIPTQDKNRPKADFCPSGFINFGQQKSCTPIRIFQTSHRGWSTAKIMYEIL